MGVFMVMLVATAVIVIPVRVMVGVRLRRIERMHQARFLFRTGLFSFGTPAAAHVHFGC